MRECFASVLSLAQGDFRTDVPEPLLVVPKGDGEGKGKTKERGTMHRRDCVNTMVSAVIDPAAEVDKGWARGTAVMRPKTGHGRCPEEH